MHADTFGNYGIHVNGSRGPEVAALCPECSHTRKKSSDKCLQVNVDKGTWNCKHCGWTGGLKGMNWRGRQSERAYIRPDASKVTGATTDAALEYLMSRRITREVIVKNKITSGTIGERPAILFPYFDGGELVNIKSRAIDDKAFVMESGAELVAYCLDNIGPTTIFAEGEIDSLSLQSVGFDNAISVPNGAPAANEKNSDRRFEYLNHPLFDGVEKFILAVDSDAPGRKLEQELSRRLGKDRCWRVTWPEDCKDANDVLVNYGADRLRDCVNLAVPYPVAGIYTMLEAGPKIMDYYENGLPRGSSTGWGTLDELYTVKSGELTVVTGRPNDGKSTWIDALAVNMAEAFDWGFAVFSPENQPVELHLGNLIQKHLRKPWSGNARLSKSEAALATLWVNEHFHCLYPEQATVDEIITLAKVLVRRSGIKGLIIDPWNEIEHNRGDKLSETEYTSKCLSKIKKFARDHDVHVWLVAHPTKLYRDKAGKFPKPTAYDISGSAHFFNKADNVVCVWRDNQEKNDMVSIDVQKVRFRTVGRRGECILYFDQRTGRYEATL